MNFDFRNLQYISMDRGIQYNMQVVTMSYELTVAPHAGAWIETVKVQ